jgi:hypothetical protein
LGTSIGDDDIPLAGGIDGATNDGGSAKSEGSSDGEDNEKGGIPIPVAAGGLALAALAFVVIGVKTGFLGGSAAAKAAKK